MYTECDSLNMIEHPCSSTHKRKTMKDVFLEQGCKFSPIRNTVLHIYIYMYVYSSSHTEVPQLITIIFCYEILEISTFYQLYFVHKM